MIFHDMLRAPVLGAWWFAMNRLRTHRVESWNVSPRARVGHRAIIRRGVEVYGDVVLGDDSYISGPRTYVEAARIGKFCSIAHQVVIGPGGHDPDAVTTHPFPLSPAYGALVRSPRPQPQRPPPVIGNDVWIGINSVILRGVTIGDGAVVAAQSVVTRDVAPYSIVGGAPARLIRPRFAPDIADRLGRIRWWDWSEEKLRAVAAEFGDPAAFVARFG